MASVIETSPSTSNTLAGPLPSSYPAYLNSGVSVNAYNNPKLPGKVNFIDSSNNNSSTLPETIGTNQQPHSTKLASQKPERPSKNENYRSGPNPPLINNNGSEPLICTGCNRILDRYLLKALDKPWHEDCLKCDACGCRLAEVGKSFFLKCGKIYCRRDYARLFGPKGTCSACNRVIPALELVMRANANVYHLECFGCQECNLRFCVGDTFYLDTDNNKILCEYDYHERLYFAQLPQFGYNSLAQLKRQISQVEDYDDPTRPAQDSTYKWQCTS